MGDFRIWFALTFSCYALRTVFNVARYRGSPIARKKATVTGVYIIMGLLWFSWFQMCFSDPLGFHLSRAVRYVGLVLFVSGVCLFLLSHVRISGSKEEDGLVTGGIYSKVRNPMYLGFIIWVIGLPLFTESMATLASSTLWIAHLLTWKILEEKELLSKHPRYAEYMKKTWF